MGYVSNDSSLWFNLAGCVAAYQPVRAPGPLLARYNQAHGGDNRYKAVDGVAPTWSPITGWGFNIASAQVLATNIYPISYQWSYLVRYSGVTGAYHVVIATNVSNRLAIAPNWGGSLSFFANNAGTSGLTPVIGQPSSGILGIVSKTAYKNGVSCGTIPGAGDPVGPIFIGGWLSGGICTGNIQSILIVSRLLSPSEVWTVTLQMQYCDVNPDWSAWGRRRQWYYAPSVGGLLRHPGMSGHIESGRMHPGMSGGIDG